MTIENVNNQTSFDHCNRIRHSVKGASGVCLWLGLTPSRTSFGAPSPNSFCVNKEAMTSRCRPRVQRGRRSTRPCRHHQWGQPEERPRAQRRKKLTQSSSPLKRPSGQRGRQRRACISKLRTCSIKECPDPPPSLSPSPSSSSSSHPFLHPNSPPPLSPPSSPSSILPPPPSSPPSPPLPSPSSPPPPPAPFVDTRATQHGAAMFGLRTREEAKFEVIFLGLSFNQVPSVKCQHSAEQMALGSQCFARCFVICVMWGV